MRNVRIHDLYVHDVGSEGIYLGQHAAPAAARLRSPPDVPERRCREQPERAVAPARFREFMDAYLDDNYRRLEWWTARATLRAGQPPVVYPVGARVLQGGTSYEALSENQEREPAANPDVWRALPPPADDVRLAPDSPHAGLGIR
jgi:hypothetical protein